MDAHCALSEVRIEVFCMIYINASIWGILIILKKGLTSKKYVRDRKTSVRKLYEILRVITNGQHIYNISIIF